MNEVMQQNGAACVNSTHVWVCVHKCLLECVGLEDLRRSFFGQSQEGCEAGNSFSVGPDH